LKTANTMTWEEAVLWLKQQPDQVDLVRACFYDDPLLEAAERYYHCSEWKAVREVLPRPPGKALDLGAGRGISSYALTKEGWITTALEPDPSPTVGTEAIRALFQEAGLMIEIKEDRGEKLPWGDHTFDLVLGRQVLHHAADLQRLCREVARVLKPGGIFIATREHVISKRADLEDFLKAHPLHRLYGGENAYLLKEYLGSITTAGLEIQKTLNPFQSNINLFPETLDDFKKRLAKKIKFPWPHLIPRTLLTLLGSQFRLPGRLYTFVARKRDAE